MIKKIVAWFTAKDERTWISHGLWGLLFGLTLGWSGWLAPLMFTLGAFTFREFTDLIDHIVIKKDRTVKASLRDGWGDWISPLIGVVLGITVWFAL